MKIILSIALFFLATNGFTQVFRLPLASTIREVVLINPSADVEIKNASPGEIKIEFSGAAGARKPAQNIAAQTDNTGKGLHYKQAAINITFSSVWSMPVEGKYIIEVPPGVALVVQGPTDFKKALTIKDFKGNLDIRSVHDVTIVGLTAGLILQSPSGTVSVRAGSKKINQPISVITESGNVVFQMPRRMGVDLKLGTGTGKILGTLSGRGGGTTKIDATQFSSSLNGGGTEKKKPPG